MGGKEDVLESQSIALSTLQPEGGLWVRCIPRIPAANRKAGDALPGLTRAGSSGQLEALAEHPGKGCAQASQPALRKTPLLHDPSPAGVPSTPGSMF